MANTDNCRLGPELHVPPCNSAGYRWLRGDSGSQLTSIIGRCETHQFHKHTETKVHNKHAGASWHRIWVSSPGCCTHRGGHWRPTRTMCCDNDHAALGIALCAVTNDL